MVERRAVNAMVVGSNPTPGAERWCGVNASLPVKEDVAGSNPAPGAKKYTVRKNHKAGGKLCGFK
jgi:hypothetical protein